MLGNFFTGAGGNFSAGWDLSEGLSKGGVEAVRVWPEGVSTLARLPVPTIAAIEGYCLGQGMLYAACCDLRVAAENAKLGFPEIQRGFFPSCGTSHAIVRLIGRARAKELMFLGQHVSAKQAHHWGLVNRVVPAGMPLSASLELAHSLAAGPGRALASLKALIDAGGETSLDAALALEADLARSMQDSPDAREGISAFNEGRPPDFVGT